MQKQQIRVRCSGSIHTIAVLPSGQLIFPDHPAGTAGFDADEAIVELGGVRCRCAEIYAAWKKNALDGLSLNKEFTVARSFFYSQLAKMATRLQRRRQSDRRREPGWRPPSPGPLKLPDAVKVMELVVEAARNRGVIDVVNNGLYVVESRDKGRAILYAQQVGGKGLYECNFRGKSTRLSLFNPAEVTQTDIESLADYVEIYTIYRQLRAAAVRNEERKAAELERLHKRNNELICSLKLQDLLNVSVTDRREGEVKLTIRICDTTPLSTRLILKRLGDSLKELERLKHAGQTRQKVKDRYPGPVASGMCDGPISQEMGTA